MIKEIFSENGCALILCQDIPGVVMLGGKSVYSQILRSTDYGETWNDVLSSNNLQTNDIEVDPLDPFHLVECSYSTNPYNTFFHESFNHGETWVESDLSSLSGKGYDILLSTTLPGRFLCATANGIYLSDDGENFDQVLGVETLMLEEDVDRPGEMYAACGYNGVYKSIDSGISWEPMADLYGEAEAPSVTFFKDVGSLSFLCIICFLYDVNSPRTN